MTLRLLICIFLASLQTPALAGVLDPLTREELAMMPPYCTALIGKHIGLPQPQDSPLRNTIPDGCGSLHHYCFGLQSLIRVDRSRGVEQKYWLSQAIGHFKERSSGWEGSTCPLRPEAYTNLGKALLRQNKALAGQAVANFNKALDLRPDYVPAYLALSDAYLSLGKKGEALNAAAQGLKYLPDSKGLLRRFKELGGKTPPTPVAAAQPAAPKVTAGQQATPGQTSEPGAAPQQSSGAGANSEHPAPIKDTSPGKSDAEHPATQQAPGEAGETKIGTPTNPYCRFCPPE